LGRVAAEEENGASMQGIASICVEVEADVIEPLGDEVFVAGVEDVGVVEQEDS